LYPWSQSLRQLKAGKQLFLRTFLLLSLCFPEENVSAIPFSRTTIIEWIGKLNYGCWIHILLKGTKILTSWTECQGSFDAVEFPLYTFFSWLLTVLDVCRNHISKSLASNEGQKRNNKFLSLSLVCFCFHHLIGIWV
jgi:hypothetical protein